MPTRTGTDEYGVPAPPAPDDPEAWYAPEVRAQYEVHPGVTVTVRERSEGFDYETREPSLSPADEDALQRVREHFAEANLGRPLTREGCHERMRAGFAPKYRLAIDRLVEVTPAARRRVEYYALRELKCLGPLTPLALDASIEAADAEATADRLVVHTADYAPAVTELPADPPHIERFAAERVESYHVGFRGFEVPVVVYRDHLLGADPFAAKYAVLEPDLLPGDRELVAECKERIWEGTTNELVDDPAQYVRDRARRYLTRQLTARDTRAWLDDAARRVRSALAGYGLAVPPVNDRYAEDRLADLVYYVLRDYVGQGKLTIPVRDPHLEDIEANRVDERVKVVPRDSIDHDGRIPTNLTFESESEFVNVVTQLAAADGVELNASNPSAKVNLRPKEVSEEVTIRCAVALPTISEDGPHISIRKQAPEAMTPVDLMERETLPPELVALLWMTYEHHGVVLFSGPTGVGKTTIMNAHMPFIEYEDRPISIDEGSREVRLPHETGVSLTTRDHENEHKRVSMADLMTECNYLNPDVEVIAEINTPASFQTFAASLNTGHGLIGTTHADDVETLVNRVVEQGLPAYLLRELDLVVFPRHVEGERYVGHVVEFLSESEYRRLDPEGDNGTIRKDDTTVYWNTVLRRAPDGEFEFAYDHSGMTASTGTLDGGAASEDLDGTVVTRVFHRIGRGTDRPPAAVEREFHGKLRYVRYLRREGVTDFDALYEFLADLRADEAATVERARFDTAGHERATDGGESRDDRRGPGRRTEPSDGGGDV